MHVRSPGLAVGAILVIVLATVVGFSVFLVSADDLRVDPDSRLLPASRAYPLGTDPWGRSLLALLIVGARTSMLVGISVVIVAGLIGLFVGLVTGYMSRLDAILMRIMDGMMAFPGVLLALAFMAMVGPRVENVIIALSIMHIPKVARLIRSGVLSIRETAYVEAAEALGASTSRILVRHVLPNCYSTLLVQLSYVFATAVLTEAALSFLGVGVPAEIPTWGSVLSAGKPFMRAAPWLTFFPGLAIAITVLSFNLVGDGLRDILDPRLRHRHAME